MTDSSPLIVLIGGPNGAGKSTTAPLLLRDALQVDELVNADVIAQGISAFHPERAAMQAGRTMLRRVKELARQKASLRSHQQSGRTLPSLTGNGRPSMSRISARGEMPNAWKTVAWMSGGPQGRVLGKAPCASLLP